VADHSHKHNPYAEWYYNTMRFPGGPGEAHHKKHFGGAPYDDFLDKWDAKDFKANDMVKLFAKAGARYVVPVTKHHVSRENIRYGAEFTGRHHTMGCAGDGDPQHGSPRTETGCR
jgi:hypothetical protein